MQDLFVSYLVAFKDGTPCWAAGFRTFPDEGKIACSEDVETLARMVQDEVTKLYGTHVTSTLISWRRLED